jgi:hypothetical protein
MFDEKTSTLLINVMLIKVARPQVDINKDHAFSFEE